MAAQTFIPVGRTSLVRRGKLALQIQTEYASRPAPRITTTISTNGQVLHKVQRPLEKLIDSFEEQRSTERTMLHQHEEVIEILKRDNAIAPSPSIDIELAVMEEPPEPVEEEFEPEPVYHTVIERLEHLHGVERIYGLDNEGRFTEGKIGREFKKSFSAVFKNLNELMHLFCRLPGVDGHREIGVYEVEWDRLFFVSAGDACYFVLVKPSAGQIDYEQMIRTAVDPSPF